ncbi:MAG: DUF58 domain-containing protein [Byssovorax sp.]
MDAAALVDDVERLPDLAPDASLLSPEMAARLGRLSLHARAMAEARRRGRRRTRRIGGGSELIDTRPYAVGDDPRRIAWAAYARLEKLLVRLVADEAPLRLALVIDASASMGFGAPTKLRQAARIAAGLAAVALSGEDRIAALGSSAAGVSALRATGGRGGLLTRLLRAARQAPPRRRDGSGESGEHRHPGRRREGALRDPRRSARSSGRARGRGGRAHARA